MNLDISTVLFTTNDSYEKCSSSYYVVQGKQARATEKKRN
jgi:hypothetical protein